MKNILLVLLYLIGFGGLYYWFLWPTVTITGQNFADQAASFIRLNIPQFFVAVFILVFPLVWLLMPKFKDPSSS